MYDDTLNFPEAASPRCSALGTKRWYKPSDRCSGSLSEKGFHSTAVRWGMLAIFI